MANRHLSRSIVLQTLFEWDFSPAHNALPSEAGGQAWQRGSGPDKDEIKKILNKNLKEFAPGLEDDNFVFKLLDAVLEKRAQIDEIIEASAPDWPLNKISIVDRNILRIGLTELLFGDRSQVPPKVAINEAIELAKTFGGENSGKFVNGVLGAVYKEMGEPGKEHVGKKRNVEPHEAGEDIAKLPVENLGGALVYTKRDSRILFALVHDVFGYWTLSKGKVGVDENIEEGTQREIKEEIGLDITIEAKLGENEYVATHPEKGKTLKKVAYFLASSPYRELVLEKSGGLDAARWFEMAEVSELRMYNDIIPLIRKAVEIISKK